MNNDFLEIFSEYEDILMYKVWHNSVRDYLLAFLLFLAIFVVTKLFKRLVVSRCSELAKKTSNHFDDELAVVVRDISGLFYYVLALYFPLRMLTTLDWIEQTLHVVFLVVVAFELVKIAQAFAGFGLKSLAGRGHMKEKEAHTTFQGLRIIINILLWIVGVLLVLSNLGVNVSSLVASLGIGGIAVALAVQNILADMFSSFSIYFDRPFSVGDYIVVGTDEGTVKKIGLKTTRIETLQGEELVISNKELTSARIQNFKKLRNRRVAFSLALVYETANVKLQKVNEIVKKVIDDVDNVEFSRSHFKTFGDHSLDFEVVYYVLSSEYVEYMNKQQEINFGIKEAFEKEKIEMAFPTQTVHVKK